MIYLHAFTHRVVFHSWPWHRLALSCFVTAVGLATLPALVFAQTLNDRLYPTTGTTWDQTLWTFDVQSPRRVYQTGPNTQPTGSNFWNVGAQLFAYGTAAGDLSVTRGDESYQHVMIGAVGPEGTTPTLPVFGKNQGSFYINNNGSVSFGAEYTEYRTNLAAYRGPGALLSIFGADVDTRGGTKAAIGNNDHNLVRYRTVQSSTELAAIGQRIAGAQPGVTNFSPLFAEVVTWDHVGVYPYTSGNDNPSTFQMVIASDGLQSYALYLYPNRSFWWDRSTAELPDSFAKVGVADGTGNIVMEAAGSGTSGVRDLWFLSNAENSAAGTQIFQIGNSTATLDVNGTHTLPSSQGTAVTALTFADNAAGHTVTSSTVTGSLLFNALRFTTPANTATFTDRTVALANAADAIIHGNLTFTDNTVLVARVANAVNGGTLMLQKEAKLAVYAANATSAATTLRFDNSAGGTGGSFDLRGFDTTIGGISSLGPGTNAGIMTNSGSTFATLTSSFNTATHTFGGVLQNGTAALALAKAGTGTLVLTGANTFTGGVRLSAGTLQLGSAQAIGSSGSIMFTGGTLQFTAANTTDYSARFSNAANQSLRFDTNGQPVMLATALTIAGGSLTKLGAGTLTLGASATYSGTTVVRGGTLSAGVANAFSPNSALFIVDGATVALNGRNQTVGDLDSYDSTTGLNDAGTVNLGSATLTNLNRVTNNWAGTLTGNGTVIKQGTATMNWYGQNDFSGTLQIAAGTVSARALGVLSPNATVAIASGASLNLNGGAQTIAGLSGSGTVSLASGTLTTNQAGNSTFAGVITGTGRVAKGGAGTLTLSTANTYSGGTTLNLGTLVAGHTAAFGTGTVRINAGTLNLANLAASNALDVRGGSVTGLANYTGTQTVSALMTYSGTVGGTTVVANGGALNTTGATFTGATTVQTGGAIRGTGTLGALTLNSGATLTPGNSPGTLTAGNTTWNGGANYVWEINNAASPATSAGTHYDLLSISGTLTINATADNKFTLSLVSLLGDNTAGDVINFNAALDSAYMIATATGGIFGFDANAFTINSAGFSNALAGGTWSLALANSNRDLTLNFTAATAIPEPSTYAMLAGIVVLGLAVYCRRRSQHRP